MSKGDRNMEFKYDEKENKIKLEIDSELLTNAFNEREDAIGQIKKS